MIHDVNRMYSKVVSYLPRWIAPQLVEAIRHHPVVILTGARQVGKSTLLRNEEPFRHWAFHTLDDLSVLRQAKEDPESLVTGTNPLVLDEVQRAPDLLLAVKKAVDEDPARRFLLSGSANLLLLKEVSENLAGRAVFFTLNPLTYGEMAGKPPPPLVLKLLSGEPANPEPAAPIPDLLPLLLRGWMPALLRMPNASACSQWWNGYVSTYLERDMRQFSQITQLVDFRRVMELTALRSGQILNQSEVSRDAGFSQPTIHRYLNLLESTYLFQRLPAYTISHTTGLLKTPKSFWVDSGLAIFLAGYYSVDQLAGSRELGGFLETMIYLHLRVLAGLLNPPAKLYYWRQRTGAEVDFVVEYGRRRLAIEVKQNARPRYQDTVGLRAFLAGDPQATGILLHGGEESLSFGERLLAVPWSAVTGDAAAS